MWKILRTGAFNGMTAFASCVAFTVFTLVLGRFDALGAGSANVVFAVNNLFYCVMCALSDGVCIVSGRRHGANDTVAVSFVHISLYLEHESREVLGHRVNFLVNRFS